MHWLFKSVQQVVFQIRYMFRQRKCIHQASDFLNRLYLFYVQFKPEQCHVDPATGRLVPPPLEFAVLDAVMEKLPGFPIVLHGSSSVPQEEVDTINKYGGKLEAAIGIPEEQLRKAAKSAVCKINIDSDSRLAMTAAIRKTFAEKPAEFDPRKYLGPARDNMEKLYKHKIINVLGSENKLAQLD